MWSKNQQSEQDALDGKNGIGKQDADVIRKTLDENLNACKRQSPPTRDVKCSDEDA